MEAVLGISPGTRTVALAVLTTGLADRRIKRFTGKWSVKKYKHILSTVEDHMDKYNVSKVACKIIHPSLESYNLNTLVEGIRQLCKRKGIKLVCYSTSEMYFFFNVRGRRYNKRQLIEHIIQKYPQMSREATFQRKAKHPYHVKIFEAIAVAELFQNPL